MGGGPGTVLDSTRAFCPVCATTEHALVTAREDGVHMERICPVRGTVSVKIAESRNWYLDRMGEPRAIRRMPDPSPFEKGCPFDCGPCECHTAGMHLPVVSVTNLCDLDCPICFTYNRPDRAYCKSADDMRAVVSRLTNSLGTLDVINITGGEPTLHPDLFELLDVCADAPIGRVTMNSNGLRIAADEDFAERLAGTGVQVVLSLDTFDPEKSVAIHGRDITEEKRKALRTLERLSIPTTILTVCVGGINEEETAEIARDYLPRSFVRGVTIQNMTFTGKNGKTFQPRRHVTLDAVEDLLSRREGFAKGDFFPLGGYHPLCYSAAYYITDGERLISLSRLVDRRLLTVATTSSYVLDPTEALVTAFREGIDRLWSEGEDPGTLALLRRFLDELYPAGRSLTRDERLRKAEGMIRMLYIHPHMDEDNFDIARVSGCGDMVPDETGRMIPACSYNLLYRQKDERFWVED